MNLFAFTDYKRYLNERLDNTSAGGGRGSRSRLASHTGVQTSYLAQVLRGNAQLSLEQAEQTNVFLQHTEKESLYFLTLVQSARAGSVALRNRLAKQIASLREEHLTLKNRLSVSQPLNEHHQVTYYSSWLYGAIHALVSVPGFQSAEKIANELKVSPRAVTEAIEFLSSCGILVRERKHLKVGNARLHLPSDSPLIQKHHINWRLKAIQNLENEPSQSLHYSSVVSLSESDAKAIHEQLIQTIQKLKAVVHDSPEEDIRSICIDFFKP